MIKKIVLLFGALSFFFSCLSNNNESKKQISYVDYEEIDKSVNFQMKENSESLKILTWNIKDLGRTKDSLELLQIAIILRDYDIVAIQEVVARDPAGAQAVAKIADELNRMGSEWNYSISDPTKSPSVYISERYAFLWKTSKVKLANKPYLDNELEFKVNREPYIAKFIKGDDQFFIINFHARIHSDNPDEEIIHLKDYPKRLNSDKLLIVGDFNLNEKHSVWDIFYAQGFKSALKNTPTILKTKCKKGQYFNYPIDNIYFNATKIRLISSGRIDFVGSCENLESARNVSDHLPVFLEFKIN